MIMQAIFRYVITQKVKRSRPSENWTYGEMALLYRNSSQFQRKMQRLYKLITKFWDENWWKY